MVLAAHPHGGVLIDSRGFLKHNSAFNSVHNTVLVRVKPESDDSLSVIIGVMDEERCIVLGAGHLD